MLRKALQQSDGDKMLKSGRRQRVTPEGKPTSPEENSIPTFEELPSGTFDGNTEKSPAESDGGLVSQAKTKANANANAKGKSKAKAKTGKDSSELPNEPAAAPETPKAKRSKEDYPAAGDDIFTDTGGDDDDLSEEVPSVPKLVDKLPKAKYIRFRPGAENLTALYTIKLDEEDQRPGEMNVYVVTKEMRDYFENQLGYKVSKMLVIDAVTLQGDQFMFMSAAVSDLTGNSWEGQSPRDGGGGYEGVDHHPFGHERTSLQMAGPESAPQAGRVSMARRANQGSRSQGNRRSPFDFVPQPSDCEASRRHGR
jgi:hypothetical protein